MNRVSNFWKFPDYSNAMILNGSLEKNAAFDVTLYDECIKDGDFREKANNKFAVFGGQGE